MSEAKLGAFSRALAAVLVATTLAACGGGGSGAGTGGGGSGGGAGGGSQQPPVLPKGTLSLLVVSRFDTQDRFGTVNEAVHLIVPATGEATALFANTRTSGAVSTIATFSFDERVFVLRNNGDVSGFGGGDWREVDVAAPAERNGAALKDPLPLLSTTFTDAGNTQRNCLAVNGSTLFWKTPDAADGLRSVGLGTPGRTAGALVIPTADAEHCYGILASASSVGGLATFVGGMDVAENVWYDTRFDPDSGLMEFFTRTVGDGRPSPLSSYTPPDHPQYNRAYSFAFDNGAVYWARVNEGNQQIELWRYAFVGQPQLLLAAQAPGVNALTVSQLDVDDGYAAFMIGDDFSVTNHVVLFDARTNSATLLDLHDYVPPIGGLRPPSFSDLRVVFRDL